MSKPFSHNKLHLFKGHAALIPCSTIASQLNVPRSGAALLALEVEGLDYHRVGLCPSHKPEFPL